MEQSCCGVDPVAVSALSAAALLGLVSVGFFGIQANVISAPGPHVRCWATLAKNYLGDRRFALGAFMLSFGFGPQEPFLGELEPAREMPKTPGVSKKPSGMEQHKTNCP